MAETTEPRALSAALASPTFVTRGGGLAMHVANRHVERWAPEAGASRVRPLKNLGFVDRLVAPWIEAAQRSASMRMFSQYISTGVGERKASAPVSWVFPRPWYQDELDWMAAARATTTQAAPQQAPSMFTTRGTYMAQAALPAALYEYVAPSLSLARDVQVGRAEAFGGDAYSPLVPHAATQAATVMSRIMAPLAPSRALSPGLRAVLTTMLERSARTTIETAPTRTSLTAPELVTPPAPRAADEPVAGQALAVADHYAEQSARIVELQRAARIVAEREAVAREAIARQASPAATSSAAAPERTAAITTRSEAAASSSDAVAAERARIEERIAQRLAERQADAARGEAVRQVEQARVEATQRRTEAAQRRDEAMRLHEASRDAAARDARTAPATTSAPAANAPTATRATIPTEIAAALSALPAELASVVAAGIGARPERAAQAIVEIGEALRTVELMARTTAAGGTFESSRGPRLMMPAGLGGLVATIERTTTDAAAAPRSMSMAAARALAASSAAPAARAAHRATTFARVPALPFLAAPRAAVPAPTSALGATAAAEPAALTHVAWADRWLARFAGAKTQSLDALTAASAGSPETRMAALAAAAPGAVFVSPAFADESVAARSTDAPAPFSPAAAAQGALAARPLGAGPAAAPVAERVVRFDDDAETPDDVFAAISQAATRSRVAPPPATRAEAVAAEVAAAEAARTFERETLADVISHAVPSAPGAGLAAQLASSPFAPALRHVLPLAAAPAFDIRALFGGGLGSTYLAGLLAPATREIEIAATSAPAWASWAPAALAEREAPSFEPEYVAPAEPVTADARASISDDVAPEAQAAVHQLAAPLMTLRSALLSWNVDTLDAGETRIGAPAVTETRETALATQPAARSLIDAMTLPTLGESAALRELGAIDLAGGATAQASSYASPGALADRAQAWSVAQERSVADLSFDFVPPELVLAARVYGLGPAEAAQAARLAIAGHGSLSAMAGAVDRTFVQALAIEHERRTAQPVTAYPTLSSPSAETHATSATSAAATSSLAEIAFGVQRRTPRGAFLWPSGTIAALGLNAAAPDGDHAMSVAALELLAAQAVAELGTYAALSPARGAQPDRQPSVVAQTASTGALPASAEPGEQDVLATATSLVSSARRAKFEAMYIALGQSAATRSWSPAARAARAVALAGRGDETITARERAGIAWDVLPVLSIGELGPDGEPVASALSTGQAAERAQQRRELDLSTFVERPGLGTLSARAGEALGSYVTPSAAPAASQATTSSRSSTLASRAEPGALVRPPTAAPELVQTGAASSRAWQRHGGGDHELPPWFEEAAKKMLLADRGGGPADNISLSELTLITSAPSTQIAASTRSAPSALPTSAATKTADNKEAQLDIEKIANDVYRQILVIMDATRARNGEPYL